VVPVSGFFAPLTQTLAGPPASIPAHALLGHVWAILRARTSEAVWAASVAGFRALGFGQVLYGYSPDARGMLLGSSDDFLVLATLPREVMRELVTRGHHLQSVSFTSAMRNPGVVSWSIEPVRAGLPGGYSLSPEALAFYAAHGIDAGLSIGFASTSRRGAAVLALVAPSGVPQAQVDAWLPIGSPAIEVLAEVTHRALTALPWSRPSGDLSARQREVLEWVADGKTTADIATILGLRPATVEKHLRLARECLGVETTAHALIKAAFLNQVFVSGDVTVTSG
jgi:DNA-binding CsgD family transcriptional regulator